MSNSLWSNIWLGVKHNVNHVFRNRNPYKEVGFSVLQLKYIKHLPKHKEAQVSFLGKPFFVKNPREFIDVVREIFIDKQYLQQLPENAVVLDCGAHIGLSVLYTKTICPTARITAFEPDKYNFQLLSKNVAAQQLSHVVLENKAIWKEETTLQFEGGVDMGSHLMEGGGEAQFASSEAFTVKTARLRDVMISHAKIDFLKVDIEGAEYDVLKDIEDQLYRVDNFFLEYHGNFAEGHKLNEMLAIVTKNGFGYYIQEAGRVYATPFYRKGAKPVYDVQLNIYCFRP
ncbi:FkbM family methyltransferase [Filimonas zeae]|uniref:Methyltransferase FkbM domain-containing protein n=1 Tax=Filimonas zeae TaxID=1737353 RepID=A0A917MXK7_9BACT|nr:FkbM family methyltransferase [Filimonas zeae]MDR6340684.1 FkbM family methyltransferase [Filimonas zeae]GGH73884.1 hypothetical protein GCM10011379_35900 [Filimonas zeae]